MKAKDRDLVVLLGIPFDNLDMDETVSRIEGFVLEGSPRYVATANVNFVVKAMQDDEFQEIVRLADIITADGMPLVWASRIMGHPLKERVTGSDLVPRLIALAARKGWGVFFLGGEPGVAEEAIARLKAVHPGLKAGCYSPEFKPLHEMANAKILALVHDFAPQLLFVSLGAGKAEKWIRMHFKELGVPVCIGVGATVDFLAGRVKRAPEWMRSSGLEWLWRILQEPGRLFKRYLYDFPSFAYALFSQWRMERSLGKARTGQARSAPPPRADRVKVLAAGERLDASTIGPIAAAGSAALSRKRPVVVDLSSASFLDSSGLGGLVGLEKQARDTGTAMALACPPPRVRELIKLARLDTFFKIFASVEEAASFARSRTGGGPAAKQEGRTLTVSIEGRLDSSNSRAMRDALFPMAHQPDGWDLMVLDLSRLDFVDSSGLGMLILLNKKLANAGRELALKGLTGPARNVVSLARLERYFRMVA